METTKNERGRQRLKIGAGGGGGIIVIGGALVAAAVGAAFAAHRARDRTRGKTNRGAIHENKEEERGLQTLLPSIEEQEAGVFSAAGQENTSEIGETMEGEESERTGSSSAESREDLPLVEIIELKKASEMIENFEDEVREVRTKGNGYIDHSEEEYAFDSSVEIQETGEIHGSCKIPQMIAEIKGSEIEDSIYKIGGPIDNDFTLEEFSFWNGKSSTPEIQSEQSLTELETTHLPEEQENFCTEEVGEKREEGSEVVEACSAELSEDATWPATPIEREETSEIKQQLQIAEKTENICGSDGGEEMKTLQYCIGQKQGEVFVNNSEEAQENACNDFKIVAEILDIPHVEGEEEEEGSSIKSEETELRLEDVGERGGEESEGSRNSSVQFSDQAVWPEDELVKVDDSMSISEMEHQLKISRNVDEVDVSICCTNYYCQLVQESISDSSVEINTPNNETSENLKESEIIHVEVEEETDDEKEQERLPFEEESEGEESIGTGKFSIELEKCLVPMYEMKQELESREKIDEMVDEAQAEGTENTTGGIPSFLPSDDQHKQVSIDSSVEAQDKVFMNLDMENEIDLEHDVVNACSFTDTAFNSSQDQNQKEREESEVAHVREEEQEEEKGLQSIENEMKLQSEMPKKTTDFRQAEQDEEEEHEQVVPKKESETVVTYKEKRTDFVLTGSSILFLLVLITLAVGLLAFVHRDHLHHHSLRLPKIYRQMYQLFFPSYNGVVGEL